MKFLARALIIGSAVFSFAVSACSAKDKIDVSGETRQDEIATHIQSVSYTHLTLPTTPYV